MTVALETVEKLSVIANQSADWCGDPPNLRKYYVSRVENVANWGGDSHASVSTGSE